MSEISSKIISQFKENVPVIFDSSRINRFVIDPTNKKLSDTFDLIGDNIKDINENRNYFSKQDKKELMTMALNSLAYERRNGIHNSYVTSNQDFYLSCTVAIALNDMIFFENFINNNKYNLKLDFKKTMAESVSSLFLGGRKSNVMNRFTYTGSLDVARKCHEFDEKNFNKHNSSFILRNVYAYFHNKNLDKKPYYHASKTSSLEPLGDRCYYYSKTLKEEIIEKENIHKSLHKIQPHESIPTLNVFSMTINKNKDNYAHFFMDHKWGPYIVDKYTKNGGFKFNDALMAVSLVTNTKESDVILFSQKNRDLLDDILKNKDFIMRDDRDRKSAAHLQDILEPRNQAIAMNIVNFLKSDKNKDFGVSFVEVKGQTFDIKNSMFR